METPRGQESQGWAKPFVEPDAELDALAHLVIGVAIEVHRRLGPGYLEQVYEEAFAIELGLRGIDFERQAYFSVPYKGSIVGSGRNDFLVGGRLVVELKAVEQMSPVFNAQVKSYLKARGILLGLLINFNVAMLREGIKRVILST